MANGNGDILDFVRNAAFGALTGSVADAATEISAAPILNDKAPFVENPNTSTMEAILYGFGALGVAAGLVEMGTNVRMFGMGKELLGTGIGLILGTYIYERDLAEKLGIRKPEAVADAPPA